MCRFICFCCVIYIVIDAFVYFFLTQPSFSFFLVCFPRKRRRLSFLYFPFFFLFFYRYICLFFSSVFSIGLIFIIPFIEIWSLQHHLSMVYIISYLYPFNGNKENCIYLPFFLFFSVSWFYFLFFFQFNKSRKFC